MKLFTVSLAILMMLGLHTADTHAQADGKWAKLAPIPEADEELFGVAAGGKMHVMGGLASGWKPVAEAVNLDRLLAEADAISIRVPFPSDARPSAL